MVTTRELWMTVPRQLRCSQSMLRRCNDAVRCLLNPAHAYWFTVPVVQAYDALGNKRGAFKDIEKLKELDASLVPSRDFNRY